MIEAVRDHPGVRAAAGGPVRRRPADRGPGGAAPPPGRDRGRRSRRPPGRLPGSGPRRDARRAQPRVAAQRLPDRRAGGLAAVRRRRASRPGSSPTRCTCWPSRSSPTSTCCRPSRPRATRWSSRPPPARPSCAGAGWCACSCASRPPSPTPSSGRRRRRLGAAAERWRWWRSAVPGASASASRLPAGTIREAIGELMCAVVPDPDGPGQRAAIEQAIADVGAARGPGLDGRLGPGADRASSARRPRWSWRSATADADRRPRVRRRAAAAQRPGLADELAADRLAPLADLSPGSRKRLRETLRGLAGRAGAAGQRGRAAGHPPADRALPAWRGCASCSATRWTIPTSGSGWRWRCGSATAARQAAGRLRRGRSRLGGAVGCGAPLGSAVGTSGPSAPEAISSCHE